MYVHNYKKTASSTASVGSSIEGGGGGAGTGTARRPSAGRERSARIKELEVAMNKRMLKHSLAGGAGAGSSSRGVVDGSSGVSQPAAGAGASGNDPLDLSATIEIVGDRLGRRTSLNELTNQGIFLVRTYRVICLCLCLCLCPPPPPTCFGVISLHISCLYIR